VERIASEDPADTRFDKFPSLSIPTLGKKGAGLYKVDSEMRVMMVITRMSWSDIRIQPFLIGL